VKHLTRSIGAGLSLIVILAACSGSPAATQGPGAATTNPGGGGGGGGGATTDPGGGGGGSGGGGTGKVTYQVTGAVQKNGELPFFAFGSRFGGDAGVALNFTTETGGAIFSIGQIQDISTVALVDEQHGLNWTNCETFEMNLNGNNATGRFECSQGFGTNVADGSVISGIKITGSFDAHG
jgi:hypothetical protein